MRSFARPRREVSDVEQSAGAAASKVVRRPAPAATAARVSERFGFFRAIAGELKKVTWPNREETQRLTQIVVAVSLVVGLSLGGIDFIFTKVVNALLSFGR